MRGRRALFPVLAATVVAAGAHLVSVAGLLPPHREVLPTISPETGFAYTAPLSTDSQSSHKAPSAALFLEDGRSIGIANSQHDDIRSRGKGRYSFWRDQLYFSTSDNSDPRTNDRLYEASWKRTVPAWLTGLLYGIAALMWIRLARGRGPHPTALRTEPPVEAVPGRAEAPTVAPAREARPPRPTREWAIRLGLLAGSVAVCLAAVEGTLRYLDGRGARPPTVLLVSPAIPGRWDAELGLTYKPNAEFKYWAWSGDVKEYEVTQRTNAWGFPDRPVPDSLEMARGGVMILGDSFIEAFQVEMGEKLGRLLESGLSSELKRPVTVMSFSHSGTGQAQQYAYWRKFGPVLKPKVVVLTFISNDIRDNDPFFSARYHRWDAVHPPRPSFVLSPASPDGLLEIPIDPDWASYTPLLADRGAPRPSWALAKFIEARLGRARGTEGVFPWYQLYKRTYVDNAFMDASLSKDAPIQAGYRLSALLIDKVVRDVRAAGAIPVFLVGEAERLSTESGGQTLYAMFNAWVRRQAQAHGASLVSVPEEVTKRGGPPRPLIRADGHWSPLGHSFVNDLLQPVVLRALTDPAER